MFGSYARKRVPKWVVRLTSGTHTVVMGETGPLARARLFSSRSLIPLLGQFPFSGTVGVVRILRFRRSAVADVVPNKLSPGVNLTSFGGGWLGRLGRVADCRELQGLGAKAGPLGVGDFSAECWAEQVRQLSIGQPLQANLLRETFRRCPFDGSPAD